MKAITKLRKAIVRGAIWIYCKIVYRMKIVGTENIPRNGAVLICGNHKSFLDPPLIEVTCKRPEVRFLAKKELTKSKFLAHMGNLFRAILVDKDSTKDMKAIKETLKGFKNGECIAIFPEGTRNGLAKGEKVKDGAAFFALNSDAVVIPVGVKGGDKPFQKVYVTYGKPMDFTEERKTKKEKETIENTTNKIMGEILKLAE